jgi:hypothetical protein
MQPHLPLRKAARNNFVLFFAKKTPPQKGGVFFIWFKAMNRALFSGVFGKTVLADQTHPSPSRRQ